MKLRKCKNPSISLTPERHFNLREHSIITGLRMSMIVDIAVKEYLERYTHEQIKARR